MSRGSKTCGLCAGKGHKMVPAVMVVHTCEHCGVSFHIPQWRSRQGRGRFCSRACVNAYQATVRGEHHCKFSGGHQTPLWYTGANWHKARKAVMARAGHKCEWCRAPLKLNGYVVHHHVGIRDFANPGEGHTVDNMSAVCKSCHAKHHGLGRMPVKGGDASV